MASPAYTVKVVDVEHYTDSYFRFRVERPEGYMFVSGQFIMLGLVVDDKPIMRAYSIASADWDEEFEFYSIIIPDGQLTSRLKDIKVGDDIILGAKAVGTLTVNGLLPGGKRLFMLSTGTGFAPFSCLIRDESIYDEYEEVYVTQTCRGVQDLTYAINSIAAAKECPLVGDEASEKLHFYGSVTREPYEYQGRITSLLDGGKFFTDLNIPSFNPETDRVMICGSLEMLHDLQVILDKIGLSRGTKSKPGTYVWERAFSG
jgi:ferredoxin--NADP+ reductase